VVTNDELAAVCRRAGVRTFVLHDLLTAPSGQPAGSRRSTLAQAQVMVPLSYANDEPVAEILEAAALLPDVSFVLTGAAPEKLVANAPANVQFTGYLDNPSYDSLFTGSDVILALTTRDLTMQRAGYEGLQAGVPVVTSGFDTLRRYFGRAAVYTQPEARAIADAVRSALGDNEALRAAGRERLRELLTEQAMALEKLKSWVAVHSERVAA
jgi:glycosyltransferase involved in cell wall biosynthesis